MCLAARPKFVRCPRVLVLSVWWEPPEPRWFVKIVTAKEGIASRIRSPPSLAFTLSFKFSQACTASESETGNIQQGGRGNDLFQQGAFVKCSLLNSPKIGREDKVL